MPIDNITNYVESFIQPVYLVGGSVRDLVLGKTPHDYDYATPLMPEEIESLIRKNGHKVYVSGKRFGTLAFKYKGLPIEITTFRVETYNDKIRKPEVNFVNSLKQDLSRRDFTINAMAIDNGLYIDPFNGQKDLKDKVIRCVGDAYERFDEDPLRMIRALRFRSELGFELDPMTSNAINLSAQRIVDVSKERWMFELDKLIVGKHVFDALLALFNSKILAFMIPELYISFLNNQDFLLESFRKINNSEKNVDYRWAILFCGLRNVIDLDRERSIILSDEIISHVGLYLKWSKERMKNTKRIMEALREY